MSKNPIKLQSTINYVSNSIISQKILENQTGGITLFAFDSNQRLSEHTAPFDAIIQLVEGQAEITIGPDHYQMTEGELIIMPANIPHSVNALTKFKMLLTMIKT